MPCGESNDVQPERRGRRSGPSRRLLVDHQDQQFEERLRIAERIVQALREAGRSCELADDDHAQGR